MQNRFSSPKTRLKVKSKLIKDGEPEEKFTRDGKRIFRYYAAVREIFTGKSIPVQILERSWGPKPFNRISRHLRKYEKETGVSVNRIEYIRSLFIQYGNSCYPNRCLGDAALEIYRRHRERTNFEVAENDASQSHLGQLEILEHLAAMRNELPEDVLNSFRTAGVFTEDFIGFMENGK